MLIAWSEFLRIFAFLKVAKVATRIAQYVRMNRKRHWFLVSAASIIHLRLNTDDRARISKRLLLLSCMMLPSSPLMMILSRITVFSMYVRMKTGANFCQVIKMVLDLRVSLGTISKNHL